MTSTAIQQQWNLDRTEVVYRIGKTGTRGVLYLNREELIALRDQINRATGADRASSTE
ncbi:hypothetical protein P0W64_15340 [Tsukamurella sp. 8F]|uniref:hypothetical protein n=1 Tax=unclassified Tsukamurella TaxID=2633480 RepID=UPI0023B8D956|nr:MULTISPECIES: hypothetical protein [unclassified Tsukamurella]MDF0530903.1 hypothetical protein [Tsukamurella sp. 8J]MDF0588152.1 hypothetical protein [Tsukamurella sp. 8F]